MWPAGVERRTSVSRAWHERGAAATCLAIASSKVNGREVQTVDQLRDEFERIGVGGTAELTVDRDGRRRKVKIELQRVG